jgi:hypothetical protein
MIPCAYLEHGTILRVVPYFLTCQEDSKKNHDEGENDEGENESGEENVEYKEDPWYYPNNTKSNSDTETQTYHYGSSDSTSSASDSSLKIHQKSYIRPEYDESSAESAARQEEINTRVRQRTAKRKRNKRNKQQ